MGVEVQPKKFSRRDLLEGALALSTLALLPGCQKGSTFRQPPPENLSGDKSIEQAPDIDFLVENYYPELKSTLSPPISSTLDTPSGIPTTAYNFTGLSFDRKAAEKIYQAIGALKMNPLGYNYENDGQELNLNIEPIFSKSRSIIIVSPDAPKAQVLKTRFNAQGRSLTVFDLDIPRAITIIRTRPSIFGRVLMSSNNLANLDFSTEVCQQTQRVVVQNRSGIKTQDQEQIAYAQDLFCKSIGALVSLRSLNVAYKSYREFVQKQDLIPYLEESYFAFPVAGPVIN